MQAHERCSLVSDNYLLGVWWFPENPSITYPGVLLDPKTDHPTLEIVVTVVQKQVDFHELIL